MRRFKDVRSIIESFHKVHSQYLVDLFEAFTQESDTPNET